jgi:hypothetical protein
VPGTVDLVIPGNVVGLQVVAGILAGIGVVVADVEVVCALCPGVANAGIERGLGIGFPEPWSDVVAGREATWTTQ